MTWVMTRIAMASIAVSGIVCKMYYFDFIWSTESHFGENVFGSVFGGCQLPSRLSLLLLLLLLAIRLWIWLMINSLQRRRMKKQNYRSSGAQWNGCVLNQPENDGTDRERNSLFCKQCKYKMSDYTFRSIRHCLHWHRRRRRRRHRAM